MRILLIEDDAAFADAVKVGLELSTVSYGICHCSTLQAAIRRLKWDAFDAVLIDLGLPDAHGSEAAELVRSIAPQLPVVVLTGEDFEAFGTDLMRHGIQDFLQKGDVSVSRIDQSLRMACERQRLEEDLKKQAAYDHLTGLANRAELNNQLHRALNNAIRQGTRVAVLAIDLDGFKQVNDRYGHLFGDIVLQQSAARILRWTRASDCAARVGGDEFIVVLESSPELDTVIAKAEKICRHLNEPINCNGIECKISASIGIALFPDHGVCRQRLCEYADEAMYAIKHNGKGAVHVYRPEIHQCA